MSSAKEGIKSPQPHDILFGRGAGNYNHHGNVIFRLVVEGNKPAYNSAPVNQKQSVARAIVDAVGRQTPPGRFLVKNKKDGLWYEVDSKVAISKTQQALREKRKAADSAGEDQQAASEGLLHETAELFVEALRTGEIPTNGAAAHSERETARKRKLEESLAPPCPKGASSPVRQEAELNIADVDHDGAMNEPRKLRRVAIQQQHGNTVLTCLTSNPSAQNYFEGVMDLSHGSGMIPVKLDRVNSAMMSAMSATETGTNQGCDALATSPGSTDDDKQGVIDGQMTSEKPCPKDTFGGNDSAALSSLGLKPSFSLGYFHPVKPQGCETLNDTTTGGMPIKIDNELASPDAVISKLQESSQSTEPPDMVSQISIATFAVSDESLTLLGCQTQVFDGNGLNKDITNAALQIDTETDRRLSLMEDFEESGLMARLRQVPKIDGPM